MTVNDKLAAIEKDLKFFYDGCHNPTEAGENFYETFLGVAPDAIEWLVKEVKYQRQQNWFSELDQAVKKIAEVQAKLGEEIEDTKELRAHLKEMRDCCVQLSPVICQSCHDDNDCSSIDNCPSCNLTTAMTKAEILISYVPEYEEEDEEDEVEFCRRCQKDLDTCGCFMDS